MKRVVVMLALLAGPAAAQTQVQTAATAAADWRRADAAMSAEYQRTVAAMKRRDATDTAPGGGFRYTARLQESQRSFLEYRDRECIIESGEFAGGSLQATVLTLCKLRLTRERSQQLVRLRWKRP